MPSIQSTFVKYAMRAMRQMSLNYLEDIDRMRLEHDKALCRLPAPKGLHYQEVELPTCSAEFCHPSAEKNPKVILYLHGGGFLLGSARAHRALVGKIVSQSGIPALSVNYRLAPEHPFPAGLDDALSAYHYLLDQGYGPKDIFFMGDSAGGGLVLSLLLKLKILELPQPLGAVVLSPWTDLTLSGDSLERCQKNDPILRAEHAGSWARSYYGSADPKSPLVSPLFGDWKDTAPILVQVGTDEILLDDSRRLGEKAAAAGAKIWVDLWEGMPHVWQFAWAYVPEAQQAIDKISRFLAILSEEQPPSAEQPILEQLAETEEKSQPFVEWWQKSSEWLQQSWPLGKK